MTFLGRKNVTTSCPFLRPPKKVSQWWCFLTSGLSLLFTLLLLSKREAENPCFIVLFGHPLSHNWVLTSTTQNIEKGDGYHPLFIIDPEMWTTYWPWKHPNVDHLLTLQQTYIWRNPRQMGRLRPVGANFPQFYNLFCKTEMQTFVLSFLFSVGIHFFILSFLFSLFSLVLAFLSC